VAFSLLGLLLLYRFARRLVDRRRHWQPPPSAGRCRGEGLRFHSRLGDLQALDAAADLSRRSRPPCWPSAHGMVDDLRARRSLAGIYLYGNTFVLPIIVTLIPGGVATCRIGWRPRCRSRRPLVVAVPMLRDWRRLARRAARPVGQRMVDGKICPHARAWLQRGAVRLRAGDGAFAATRRLLPTSIT
jgi:hypothetical protein